MNAFMLRIFTCPQVIASLFFFVPVLSVAAQQELPGDFELPPPPGQYVHHRSEEVASAFSSDDPAIATTYFYWYDHQTGSHIVDGDGTDALTDHPPTLEGFSYKNIDWHARQFSDMSDAGIDIALPVYWGTPLKAEFPFSNAGLPPMTAARERLLESGEEPPAIGMFYDTSTLRANDGRYHVDLTTEAGKRWFYGTIRNFFSLVPSRHRATIDGRPLVLLYAPDFARDVDETLFPAVRSMFREDFGVDLYLVKMRGWPGEADSEYQWGGALAPKLLDTAGIGPGYDHSAVPGRDPLVRPRDGGRFYEFSWQRLLGRNPDTRPRLVHLETWNEFHEGTEICETKEYGRKYIEMTRRFADLFHRNTWLDLSKIEPALETPRGTPQEDAGVTILDKPRGDGPVAVRSLGDKEAWVTRPNEFSENRYLYFDVDDYSIYDVDTTLEVTVAYWDSGTDSFVLHYDSADPELSGLAQEFRSSGGRKLHGSETWKEATFRLPHARFANRANGADFRLATHGGNLAVHRVVVRRIETPPEPQ
jgi:hypothetical protein